jgi:hypothetical protein
MFITTKASEIAVIYCFEFVIVLHRLLSYSLLII